MNSKETLKLDLCGIEETVHVNWASIEQLPVTEFVKQCRKMERSVVIGICGPAGSGKTLLSKLLSHYLNVGCKINTLTFSVDGYHYSNEYLSAQGIKHQKGLPISMNGAALYDDLYVLKHKFLENVQDSSKSQSANIDLKSLHTDGHYYYLPIYDRTIHDTIKKGISIRPTEKFQVIIVEGLYLLHWPKVRQLLDFCVYCVVDHIDTLKDRLVQRKCKCGIQKDQAVKHFETIDLNTFQIVESSKRFAQLLVKTSTSTTNNNSHTSKTDTSLITYETVPFSEYNILSAKL
ncbi:hypothetical protein RFI_27367 [Reticulomyxa filosa]|uniref:Phosphoribulokinase/uridine kinase domain-containing protein n=1 Tax=Reticulomyxa filosa TaxID=46433 RepID=X6M8N8_RETFI|nr:hypothetical protein RFI_27367 [Reticulomyxa filosa]|eukprot:ETO10011.1 hypothetical protein RFI_27367 [Reticulomyxa filosa]